MRMAEKELQLSSEHDGLSFYYGWVSRVEEHVRVDVLPPAPLWRGDTKTVEPDAKSWIVYMNGEEFARVERREDLGCVLGVSVERPVARGVLVRLRGVLGHG